MIDFHSELTRAQIKDINTAVRDSPPTLAQRQELAELTGKTMDTVNRWFTTAGTQRNLIPYALAGVEPMRTSLDNTEEIHARVIFGMMLAGGASGDQFHGKTGLKQGFETTVSGLLDTVAGIQHSRFYREALTGLTIDNQGDGFEFTYAYKSPAYGEDETDALYGSHLDDNPFDEPFDVEPIDGEEA